MPILNVTSNITTGTDILEESAWLRHRERSPGFERHTAARIFFRLSKNNSEDLASLIRFGHRHP